MPADVKSPEDGILFFKGFVRDDEVDDDVVKKEEEDIGC